jgi:hypothetical protein
MDVRVRSLLVARSSMYLFPAKCGCNARQVGWRVPDDGTICPCER